MDPAPTPPRHAGRQRAGLGAAVAALVVIAIAVVSLVSRGDDREPPVAAAAATTDAPPSTSTTTTTTIPSTTTTVTSAPTTAATNAPGTLPIEPTTAAPAAPLQVTSPIAPPPDPNGAEPLVQVGSISIPKIGLDAPMYEGIRLTTLNHGPGHWPGSASPGQVGNTVVAGHRTSHGAEFRHIDRLAPGDVVTFTTPDGVFDYTVIGTDIVGPDAMWIIDPSDTPTATLFACHPPGSTRQRIVVTLALA